MQAEQIVQLLTKLGCHSIKQAGNGWVNSSCPLAPHSEKHNNRQDKHPSFGVSIKAEEEGHSGYRCFTCNAKGTVSDLVIRLQALASLEGHDTSGLTEVLVWVQANDRFIRPPDPTLKDRLESAAYRPRRAVEIGGIRLSESMARQTVHQPDKPEEFLPEDTLAGLSDLSPEAYEYLNKMRGIPPDLITQCGFRWHPRARRIAIPIRDCKGRLVGVSGRAIDPLARPKFLHSKGYSRDRYLYGEQWLEEGGSGTGVLVEGFFDAIALWGHGYAAVAVLGTYLSRLQIEKLTRFFRAIVILPDGDTPGIEGAKRMATDLSGRIPVRIAPCREGMDPDELSPLDLAEALGDIRG